MRAVLIAAAGMLLCGCTSRGGGERPGATESAIEIDGVARSYRIFVPPAADGTTPLPLLLVFHGAGSSADDIERGSGFDALADESPTTRMIVVYPEARRDVRRFEADPPAGRGSADVRFADAILARIRERLPIDPSRVYASGFSNGAAFCYRLAAERPRLIAAIAPVAGYLPSLAGADAPGEPIPLIHVHGTADDRVNAPLLGVSGSAVAAWARRNGATRGPTSASPSEWGGLVVTKTSWSGATPRSDATLLLVEGAGHEWMGGPAGSVSRAIVEFLRAHPRSATPAR